MKQSDDITTDWRCTAILFFIQLFLLYILFLCRGTMAHTDRCFFTWKTIIYIKIPSQLKPLELVWTLKHLVLLQCKVSSSDSSFITRSSVDVMSLTELDIHSPKNHSDSFKHSCVNVKLKIRLECDVSCWITEVVFIIFRFFILYMFLMVYRVDVSHRAWCSSTRFCLCRFIKDNSSYHSEEKMSQSLKLFGPKVSRAPCCASYTSYSIIWMLVISTS